MVCDKCGAEVPAGSIYCNVCGSEIQIVPEYNILENDILDSYIGIELRMPEPEPEEKKQKKKRFVNYSGRFYRNIAIVAIVIAVIVLLVSVFVIRYSISRKTEASFDYQMMEAMRYYGEENYEMAISYFDKALSITPDSTQALSYQAKCYENIGELAAAESIYHSLIELDNTNLTAYEDLVNIYKAEDAYEKIRTLRDTTEDQRVLALLEEYTVAAPVFSLESGEYGDDLTITMDSNDLAIIYYTTDGSDPVENGLVYEGEIHFDGEGRYQLKAVAQNAQNLYSDVASADYVIKYEKPEMPRTSLPSGAYLGQQIVSIEVPEGCSAYYTLDGTTPTVRSFRYQTPIVLPGAGEYVLSVVYISNHGKVSDTGVFTYVITG